MLVEEDVLVGRVEGGVVAIVDEEDEGLDVGEEVAEEEAGIDESRSNVDNPIYCLLEGSTGILYVAVSRESPGACRRVWDIARRAELVCVSRDLSETHHNFVINLESRRGVGVDSYTLPRRP